MVRGHSRLRTPRPPPMPPPQHSPRPLGRQPLVLGELEVPGAPRGRRPPAAGLRRVVEPEVVVAPEHHAVALRHTRRVEAPRARRPWVC